jgi:mannose-6-phosphate isomerase-like protein (cupin superfamily)
MASPISVKDTLASFTETWSPHLIGTMNDTHVKIAKIDGEFIWHSHPNSDELFYVLAGKMTLQLEPISSNSATEVHLVEGDVYTVPRGQRHRPVGYNAHIMMLEKEGTVNTGDVEDSERTRIPKDVRI